MSNTSKRLLRPVNRADLNLRFWERLSAWWTPDKYRLRNAERLLVATGAFGRNTAENTLARGCWPKSG